MTAAARETRRGLVCAMAAYLWWGAIPLYFKAVAHVPSLFVLDQRILWSAGFLAALVTWFGRWGRILTLVRTPRTVLLLSCAALLIAVNWGVFIYAVAIGKVMQASLGYFINPLISILLGMLFLRERLRPMQWTAVVIAIVGVAYLGWHSGELPWIALLCASSFGLYGLVRKVVKVEPIDGLAIETLLLVVPAALLLPWLAGRSPAMGIGSYGLLCLSGVITVMPLIWFTMAVQRLPLSTLGFIQYIGPTGQFLLALLLFREPLDRDKLIAFVFCWSAIAVYSWSTWKLSRENMVVDTVE